jgi:hypothetical protein
MAAQAADPIILIINGDEKNVLPRVGNGRGMKNEKEKERAGKELHE